MQSILTYMGKQTLNTWANMFQAVFLSVWFQTINLFNYNYLDKFWRCSSLLP